MAKSITSMDGNNMYRILLSTFLKNVVHPRHLVLLLLGVVLTYLCVASGFDWWYFLFAWEYVPRFVLFIADGLGFLIPFLVPLGLFVYGKRKQNNRYTRAGMAVMLAALVGFISSMCIKVFTGRISPPHHGPFDIDISGAFQFGFMEYQIIGGWPSSHATVMFALTACLVACFPRKRFVAVCAYSAATFVGVGVTFGFHWFSEFLMGAVLGFVLGRCVYATTVSQWKRKDSSLNNILLFRSDCARNIFEKY